MQIHVHACTFKFKIAVIILQMLHYKWGSGGPPQVIILDIASSGTWSEWWRKLHEKSQPRLKGSFKNYCPKILRRLECRDKDSFEGMLLQSSGLQSHTALRLLQLYPKINCQRASRAKTVGLRGGQLNATRSIAADRKILDRAVKSVRCRFPGDFSGVRFHM